MGESGKPYWVDYLEHDALLKKTHHGMTIYEIKIKISHAGLQAVIKAYEQGRYEICFCGGPSLSSLSAKIRRRIEGTEGEWREDKYPPT